MASSFHDSSPLKSWSHFLVLLALLVHHVHGSVVCENLNKDKCGFAVSSSGKRCVLEKQAMNGEDAEHVCRSSQIVAGGSRDWIESDECINGCGVDRNSLGISSDSLLDSQFAHKLCSPQCYMNCPNIVDLYFNLSAAEGVFLPKLCEAHEASDRRAMAEVRSSGQVAPAPTTAVHRKLVDVAAPAPSVVFP